MKCMGFFVFGSYYGVWKVCIMLDAHCDLCCCFFALVFLFRGQIWIQNIFRYVMDGCDKTGGGFSIGCVSVLSVGFWCVTWFLARFSC